jgi:hypothetical protein
MKLKIADRIRLLAILPEKGSILTLKIVRKLREDLSFTEKEHKGFAIAIAQDRITWDEKKDKGKEVEVGDQAKELIIEKLKELSESEELTVPDMPLWEKFVGEE